MSRRLFKISFIAFGILICILFYANIRISSFAEDKIFNDPQSIPYNKVGLLLGTSKYVSKGHINLYYAFRIQAAVKLYSQKKINYILVSGDNSIKSYNEPKKIKEDLIKSGVPEDRIVLDYAGFRTLDSVVRASEVFGETRFTVISQKFHNERAIFLASKFGNNAIGYNATGVSKRYGLKVQLREYLARVKVFIDLLLGVQPKFLGEKIAIDTK